MNKQKFYTNLSKEVSYALRHAQWKYELELDENGWVSVEQLLHALHQSIEWRDVKIEDLKIMIEKSEKKRHELKENKIRALYGHSIPMKIVKEEGVPPEFLYHGTSPRFLNSIESNGLSPMSRQYVHLSEDIITAELVGKRKDKHPIILEVNTGKAREEGVKFYLGNEKVWLADEIPSEFIAINKN
ncbi:RNA 2'-phosphotransferase [Bacillus cereus]|uniref:Probable RNA 2'-phosphotransferase n=3 Tax=Bacillus cereus group TaxID=86661 RepID=KPTA_BACHK|nr:MULTISPECIES: RNA 2'-phosphotransferase [Bacillus cereus group]Q6HH75.1 RecName: Full=Probable RNA 2'-phosphotransferase [[Bacillus thuringiensis] serovar konkukian str. 97-27]MDA1850891.1 RNA 2'-phosphotransferase [Bacillus cereus]AAT60143.1 probable RNA 2'-phosphotransferase [[Bacillus thuringiensis] serovar konkukian str. 97-27]AJI35402.1 RNA 2'-phosphotransferase, Tpt1 / KptA family protein [Bacillus thuringiensis]MCC2535896.1 RNA 2'-phosphotransferase [Bacillus paranthracis]MCH5437663